MRRVVNEHESGVYQIEDSVSWLVIDRTNGFCSDGSPRVNVQFPCVSRAWIRMVRGMLRFCKKLPLLGWPKYRPIHSMIAWYYFGSEKERQVAKCMFIKRADDHRGKTRIHDAPLCSCTTFSGEPSHTRFAAVAYRVDEIEIARDSGSVAPWSSSILLTMASSWENIVINCKFWGIYILISCRSIYLSVSESKIYPILHLSDSPSVRGAIG